MTAAFGLLIAALGKTPEVTRGLSILVTLLMVMLGGAWIPTFIFPAWLQKLTIVIPHALGRGWHRRHDVARPGFASAAGDIAALAGAALLFGALAISRFRWEEGG